MGQGRAGQNAGVAVAMTRLPPIYAGLELEPGPKMLIEALRLYGTLEAPGAADNPVILAWADEIGAGVRTAYAKWAASWYDDDSTPWCGLFMAVVALRASNGRPERLPPEKYLSAASWGMWGRPVGPGRAPAVPVNMAALGDVLVFSRPGGAHVGLYAGEDRSHYHVLGGNQANAVNIMRIDKTRCIAVRRPSYLVQPANVRPIHYAAAGAVSSDER